MYQAKEHKAGGPALSVWLAAGQKNHISSHIMLRLPSDARTSTRSRNGQPININPFSLWQYPTLHFRRRVSIPRTVSLSCCAGRVSVGTARDQKTDRGQTHFATTAQSCKVDDQDGQDRQGEEE